MKSCYEGYGCANYPTTDSQWGSSQTYQEQYNYAYNLNTCSISDKKAKAIVGGILVVLIGVLPGPTEHFSPGRNSFVRIVWVVAAASMLDQRWSYASQDTVGLLQQEVEAKRVLERFIARFGASWPML